MTFAAKAPALGGRADPSELSSFSDLGNLEANPTDENQQAQIQAHERLLEIKRARNRLRRQRLVSHLHRLGPSLLGHFLREIEAGANVTERLDRYARLDPDFVRALGGDRFAPIVRLIDGE
jgi:hypothetical protein